MCYTLIFWYLQVQKQKVSVCKRVTRWMFFPPNHTHTNTPTRAFSRHNLSSEQCRCAAGRSGSPAGSVRISMANWGSVEIIDVATDVWQRCSRCKPQSACLTCACMCSFSVYWHLFVGFSTVLLVLLFKCMTVQFCVHLSPWL